MGGKGSCGCIKKFKGFNDYKIEGEIATLYFEKRNGDIHEILVDADDIPRLKEVGYMWNTHYKPCTKTFYSGYTLHEEINGVKTSKTIYLSRFIMDVTDPNITVDHWNHDTLDNRKENLRITVTGPNDKHRSSKNSNNKSGFRNVFWSNKDERWLVVLQINKKSKCFGRFKFDDLEKAGVLAEEMRQLHYGEFAGNN